MPKNIAPAVPGWLEFPCGILSPAGVSCFSVTFSIHLWSCPVAVLVRLPLPINYLHLNPCLGSCLRSTQRLCKLGQCPGARWVSAVTSNVRHIKRGPFSGTLCLRHPGLCETSKIACWFSILCWASPWEMTPLSSAGSRTQKVPEDAMEMQCCHGSHASLNPNTEMEQFTL